ncbi:MAG: ATP-binding cassette domain-containing protein [Patescibacteria group bacterium]|nr:ATP-binding cassette domain-containing protein [Patescibacteria group bacterium]
MAEQVILSFKEVSFEYKENKPLLDEADFSVRQGSKITLMGQNGAGKSTIFALIKGEIKPKSGKVSITNNATIGTASQTMAREFWDLTVEEYFGSAFEIVPVNIKSQIAKAMEAVNSDVPTDRKIGDLSGGQQARLLLAFALIQKPDILLLDEPTNNLDQAGIDHLIQFLIMYDKTVIVISHDADFLNLFTEGVIYLNAFTKKVEMYVGNYYDVVEEISARIEREERKNAQLEKIIRDRKEKVNFFANKGGKMRKLAKKMREETEEMEEEKVDVRREDKTIRPFTIPAQNISGNIVEIGSVKVIHNHQPETKKVNKILYKRTHLLVSGPNGVGKSTLLRALVSPEHKGAKIMADVRVGYYSQDFSNLDFNQTVFESLKSAMDLENDEQLMRSVAASFLITGDLMGHKVSDLSEGQKGLLSFARLVLLQPGLLILDEPTNHINFRHIPLIAEAINNFEGAVIMVSHMPDFVAKIKFDDYLDLGQLK